MLACSPVSPLTPTLTLSRFHEALSEQPKTAPIDTDIAKLVGLALFAIGGILVLSSYYRLGILGTYLGTPLTALSLFPHRALGDYFGILMKERITSFPFSVMDDPMYTGSTLIYLVRYCTL